MEELFFQNEEVEIWLEKGIIHSVLAPSVVLTLESAKKTVAERLKISNSQTHPILIDARRAKSMTKEAREYLASPEAIKGISAGAFVIENPLVEFIVKVWLIAFKPKVPSKLFKEKQKALEWLEQFKRIN